MVIGALIEMLRIHTTLIAKCKQILGANSCILSTYMLKFMAGNLFHIKKKIIQVPQYTNVLRNLAVKYESLYHLGSLFLIIYTASILYAVIAIPLAFQCYRLTDLDMTLSTVDPVSCWT